ncbi:MaoC family dehydratase [Citrobacter sp. RHB25-C09]|uniref:MaoC family dehydratase n=1 Tax=Citrobacter sp. RHB25-C09 TaxID=2742624 RepID=UPI0015EF1251|nr:MaoC family dehydratase [Citrobacter sp. RHB25-C09]QMI06723.1 MaoC family dehydratase [Citrobacter sp. RHB25-C09]
MMPLHYTQLDARRWAAFSGDYNPVHFDEAWVKAQGGTSLSVHGMRALLDVKRFISPPVDSMPFLKCTVRLRRPLWRDTAYRLMREEHKRVAASVRDDTANETCLSCQLMPEYHFPLTTGESIQRLDVQTLVGLHQLFAPLLADAQQWHFLDALLFRHLLQDDALLRQDAIASMLPECRTLDALFSRYPVVQTHQEVIFDSHLLAPWRADALPESLEIETLPALVVGDLVNGAVVRIAARTCYQNHYISNAVTLKVGTLTKGKPYEPA